MQETNVCRAPAAPTTTAQRTRGTRRRHRDGARACGAPTSNNHSVSEEVSEGASEELRNRRQGIPPVPAQRNHANERFGRITLESPVPGKPGHWRGRCECGNAVEKRLDNLKRPGDHSCGH